MAIAMYTSNNKIDSIIAAQNVHWFRPCQCVPHYMNYIQSTVVEKKLFLSVIKNNVYPIQYQHQTENKTWNE